MTVSEDLLEACAEALVVQSYDEDDTDLAFTMKADIIMCDAVGTPEHLRDWFMCMRPEDYRKAVVWVIERLELLSFPSFKDWGDLPDAGYYENMGFSAQRAVDQVNVCLYAALTSHYQSKTFKIYQELNPKLIAARDAALKLAEAGGLDVKIRMGG